MLDTDLPENIQEAILSLRPIRDDRRSGGRPSRRLHIATTVKAGDCAGSVAETANGMLTSQGMARRTATLRTQFSASWSGWAKQSGHRSKPVP